MKREKMPDWILEELLLEEMRPEEAAEARRRIENEESGAARIEALRRSNDEILAAHPPRRAAERILRAYEAAGSERARGKRAGRFLLLAPLAAAAVLAVVILPRHFQEGGMRAKGYEPRLRIYRRASDRVELLTDAAIVREKDLLQLSYVCGGRRYGAVVSLDGRGNVTRHLPRQGEPASALETGEEVPLPRAYELDDAPDFERFFFVVSDKPFSVSTVEAAARALSRAEAARAELSLPSGMEQVSVLLRKEAP
jgi:hypothetical protein